MKLSFYVHQKRIMRKEYVLSTKMFTEIKQIGIKLYGKRIE
jgi:hypothetical protein